MRCATSTLIVGATSLLAACGEAPVGQAPPEPQYSTSQAALTTSVTRIFNTGQAVDMAWSDDLSQGFFMAVTDSTNHVNTAFLSFNQIHFDPTSQLCITDPVLGSYCRYTRTTYDTLYADIRAADVTVTGNTARVQTDLATATNVAFTRCQYDDVTGVTACVDVLPAGTISLQWQKTHGDYLKSLGMTSSKTGPLTVRIVGGRASYSADTNGKVLDTVILHKPGTMGTSSTLTIDITRTP